MAQLAATRRPLPHHDKRAILIAWTALSAATILAWLLAPGESLHHRPRGTNSSPA